jgi:hypothetical protein
LFILSFETRPGHPALSVAISQKYRSDELRLMWKFLPSRDPDKAKQITEKPRSYSDIDLLALGLQERKQGLPQTT